MYGLTIHTFTLCSCEKCDCTEYTSSFDHRVCIRCRAGNHVGYPKNLIVKNNV